MALLQLVDCPPNVFGALVEKGLLAWIHPHMVASSWLFRGVVMHGMGR